MTDVQIYYLPRIELLQCLAQLLLKIPFQPEDIDLNYATQVLQHNKTELPHLYYFAIPFEVTALSYQEQCLKTSL